MPSNVLSLRRTGAFAQSVLALAAAALFITSAQASAPFDQQPEAVSSGRLMVQGVVLPGGEAKFSGRSFKPGQELTLSYGGVVLNPGSPFVANEKGEVSGSIQVPANAVAARHPLVLEAAKPTAASVVELKVSPDIKPFGQDQFTVTSQKLVPGLYQLAYSPKTDRIFVAASTGRPPVKDSQLLKVNPATLAIEAKAAAAKIAGRTDGVVHAVYGVEVDDANGNVWVTNTRENTVAVYRQSDLSLVKQFEPGLVPHAFSINIVPDSGKAYVTTPGQNTVVVFDTNKLEPLKTIEIAAPVRGQTFSAMGLNDDGAGKLYVVSNTTPAWLAVIDMATDTVEKVLPVPGAASSFGVAVDPKTKRAFIASQGSDNVVVMDTISGDVVATTPVGAGALYVALDPVKRLVYVANRGADTIAVLDVDGKLVASLPTGSFPNDLRSDGKGNVFIVNKARGADDTEGDHITRMTPR